jgi:hypothetical protein
MEFVVFVCLFILIQVVQWLRLVLSNRCNRVGVPPPTLRMETDPDFEMLCYLVFFRIPGSWQKRFKNQVILTFWFPNISFLLSVCMIHPNPSETGSTTHTVDTKSTSTVINWNTNTECVHCHHTPQGCGFTHGTRPVPVSCTELSYLLEDAGHDEACTGLRDTLKPVGLALLLHKANHIACIHQHLSVVCFTCVHRGYSHTSHFMNQCCMKPLPHSCHILWKTNQLSLLSYVEQGGT